MDQLFKFKTNLIKITGFKLYIIWKTSYEPLNNDTHFFLSKLSFL